VQSTQLFTRVLYRARNNFHVFYEEHAIISTSLVQSTQLFTRVLYRARNNFHVFYEEHATISRVL